MWVATPAGVRGSKLRERRGSVHLFADPAVAASYAEAGGRGTLLPWREALTVGWTPSDCDLPTWIGLRAKELSRLLGVSRRHLSQALRSQERALARIPLDREVVLWAGPDLSCQIFLWAWLFRLEALQPRPRVCVVVAPDIGTAQAPCLASLSGKRLLDLARARRVLTPVEIKLGAQAWRIVGARDPSLLRRALDSSWSSILDIASNLQLQLLRFPDLETGMGVIERKLLELVAGGLRDQQSLHRALSARAYAFGFGAVQVRIDLQRLSGGRHPVLAGGPDDLHLTPNGEAVLSGRRDLLQLCGPPRAIGGAIFTRRRMWRYDRGTGEVLPATRRRYRGGDVSYA